MPAHLTRYILLPARSLRGDSPLVSTSAQGFLTTLARQREASPPQALPSRHSDEIQVVDSIADKGAKLIEITRHGIAKLKTIQPGIRVVPVCYYKSAVTSRHRLHSELRSDQATQPIRIQVVNRLTGAPIPQAQVVAFSSYSARAGTQGTTDELGQVELRLPPSTPLEQLFIYPAFGYWPYLGRNLALSNGVQLKLNPIDLSFQDSLRYFYNAQLTDGAGVKVGVLDTGIASHPDLHVSGGYNAVTDEDPQDYGDNGHGHGTHVAGILAARGTAPTGIRGVAPGVELRSYRVFGANSGSASNFAIAKAINQAISDRCDLLNLSIGGGPFDPTLETAINDARQHGCVVICASGNDDRSPVSFPASESLAVGVSAIGREETYPKDAQQWANIQRPPVGTDSKNYIASFANVGPELSLTAPGDGIVSTFPGGYAVLDGTSMACPAATGRAAVLLASDPAIRSMRRNVDRSDALVTRLLQAAVPLGFGFEFEGHGMLP